MQTVEALGVSLGAGSVNVTNGSDAERAVRAPVATRSSRHSASCLLAAFALVALVLSSIGLFAVVWHRAPDAGDRHPDDARRRRGSVRRLVMRRGLIPVPVGTTQAHGPA